VSLTVRDFGLLLSAWFSLPLSGRARGEHQHWYDFACTTLIFLKRERGAYSAPRKK